MNVWRWNLYGWFGVLVLASACQNRMEIPIDDGLIEDLAILHDEYRQVDLDELLANPTTFRDIPVKFDARFHQTEDFFNEYYTGISRKTHKGFSVWAVDKRQWIEAEYVQDHPFVYMSAENPDMSKLSELQLYEPIRIYGKVINVFDDRAWIEVEALFKRDEPPLTDEILAQMRLALNALEGQRYDVARQEAELLLAQDLPDELEANLQVVLGESHLHLGDAVQAFQQLSKADPEYDRSAHRMDLWGQACLQLGKNSEASQGLRQALKHFPRSLELSRLMAQALANQGQIDEGVLQAKRALVIDAKDYQSLTVMGDILNTVKRWDEALEAYDQSLLINFEQGLVHQSIGMIYYYQQRFDHAVGELEIARRQGVDDPSLPVYLARSYAQRGERFYQDAVHNYEAGIKADGPLVFEASTELGQLHVGYQEWRAALRVLKRHTERWDQDPAGWALRGFCYAVDEIAEYAAGGSCYLKAYIIDGEIPHLHLAATTFEKGDHHLEAAESYWKLSEFFGEHELAGGAAFMAGEHFRAASKIQESAIAYTRAWDQEQSFMAGYWGAQLHGSLDQEKERRLFTQRAFGVRDQATPEQISEKAWIEEQYATDFLRYNEEKRFLEALEILEQVQGHPEPSQLEVSLMWARAETGQALDAQPYAARGSDPFWLYLQAKVLSNNQEWSKALPLLESLSGQEGVLGQRIKKLIIEVDRALAALLRQAEKEARQRAKEAAQAAEEKNGNSEAGNASSYPDW